MIDEDDFSRKISEEKLEIGHGCFHPPPFKFILQNHAAIQLRTIRAADNTTN
jgi:hypothetical protein